MTHLREWQRYQTAAKLEAGCKGVCADCPATDVARQHERITFGSSTFCTKTAPFPYQMASNACLVPDWPYSGTKKQGDNALIVAAENIIGKKGSVLKKLLRIQ